MRKNDELKEFIQKIMEKEENFEIYLEKLVELRKKNL